MLRVLVTIHFLVLLWGAGGSRIRRQADGLEDIDSFITDGAEPCTYTLENNNNIATCSQISLQDLASLKNADKLHSLLVERSPLQKVPPKALAHLPSLRSLSMTGCQISDLQQETFQGVENLQYLNLSFNELGTLNSPFFSVLRELKRLNLTENKIRDLQTQSFTGLSKLQVLDLSGNYMETLPTGPFRNTPILVWVDLSKNRISRLNTDVFQNMAYLVSVDLSYNQLVQLPARLFDNVPYLTRLILSSNKLATLTPEIFSQIQPKFASLAIASNNLTYLDMQPWTGKLPGLKKIVLSPNPWSCRCLDLMLDWLNGKGIQYQPQEYFDGSRPSCVIAERRFEFDVETGQDKEVDPCSSLPNIITTSPATQTTSSPATTSPTTTSTSSTPTTRRRFRNPFF